MHIYNEKRRFFDDIAAQWETAAFDEEGEQVARWILRKAGLAPGVTVLEPGCGAGRMTALLASAVGPEGRVLAVEMSEKMIAAARRNVRAPSVEFRHTMVEELKLPQQSVDIVLCFDVFPHFADPAWLLDTFHSWLRHDGKFILAHYPGRQQVNEIHKEAGAAVGADRLADEQHMRHMLHDHGFKVVELIDQSDRYFLKAISCRH